MTEISAIEIAKRQRHLHLLGKIKQNQALSKAELTELRRYERTIPAQKTVKRAKVKTVKRAKVSKAPKKKAPLTEAQCRRLGYDYADLLEADSLLEKKPTLAKILSRHPRLRRAFRRGQLLQHLRRLAPVTDCITHAAIRLKTLGFDFAAGQVLRDFLDRDGEALEIWTTAEANAWIDNREDLRATAKDGNVKAIQLIDAWFTGRERESKSDAPDLSHLPQQDICDLLGVTRQTLLAWEKNDRLPRNADKSYHLAGVIKWHGEFCRAKASGPAPAKDRMRDAKAERLELQVAAEKGQLLDRGEVVAGLVARAEKLAGAFRYKRRELALMLHGQTVESIEQTLGRFFDDLQTELLDVPEYLKLSAETEQKFRELLGMIGG
jgi:transcriptional regulator with XRE-family HTH domain